MKMKYDKLALRVCLTALTLLLSGMMIMAPADANSNNLFHDLKARLVKDGFDADKMDELFSRPETAFDPESVSLFFMHNESRLNYDQFTNPENIQKAASYMAKHEADLTAVQARYETEPEILAAVFLVETRLGTYLGKSRVLNSLSTMAALSDPRIRDTFWDQIPEKRRIPKGKYEKKAITKGRWAYNELKALLAYTAREDIDPAGLQGSYAGAMGICQFMPSNALSLARDGNGDGRVDLFNHADAAMSAGHYLYRHGWRRGIDRATAYKVLLRYNYSKYYVNTLLKIRKILKSR